MDRAFSRILFVTICVIFLSLYQATLSHAQILHAKKAIRLGAVVSLSGDAARNGYNWFEGSQLAIEDLNKEGFQCEMISEDDGTSPSRAASAFTKLATVDKVDAIVGGTWDFLAEASFPFAQQYKVPFVTPTNPIEILSEAAKKNPWIYTNGLSLEAERSPIRDFLESQKVKTLGLAYINVPYGTAHAKIVKSLAKELGVNVIFDREITYEGAFDLIKRTALDASMKKPDMLFVVLNYEGVDMLLKEMEKLKTKPLVLMTHTVKEAYDFAKSPDRYANAFGIFEKFYGDKFADRFRAKFGHAPYGYAAAGYDAARFMVQALAQGISLSDPKQVFEYHGITGVHKVPAPSRELVKTSAVIMTIRNGEFKEVQKKAYTPFK